VKIPAAPMIAGMTKHFIIHIHLIYFSVSLLLLLFVVVVVIAVVDRNMQRPDGNTKLA
jgi:hypothetical protein